MLKGISEFVIRVADLAEAEGRALREQTVKVGLALGLIFVGVVFLLAAAAALLVALHIALARQLGPAWSLTILGAISLVFSIVVFNQAMRLSRGLVNNSNDSSSPGRPSPAPSPSTGPRSGEGA